VTGDGLQDVVFVRSGNVVYWPNLGHGRFGELVAMRRSPRFARRVQPATGAAGRRRWRRLADLNGATVNRPSVGDVQISVSGNGTGTGWPSQFFEDTKAFFGLFAGGRPTDSAAAAVSASHDQIVGAGVQPVRVPTR
jgi:hypothetical protein